MPAVVTIGHTHYFFVSTANAAKVADLVNKADEVEREFNEGFYTYRHLKDDEKWRDVSINLTKQKKPEPALLGLPESTTPNNEYHQK